MDQNWFRTIALMIEVSRQEAKGLFIVLSRILCAFAALREHSEKAD